MMVPPKLPFQIWKQQFHHNHTLKGEEFIFNSLINLFLSLLITSDLQHRFLWLKKKNNQKQNQTILWEIQEEIAPQVSPDSSIP